MPYEVVTVKEAATKYFYIRDTETLDIVVLPSKYLMHKTRAVSYTHLDVYKRQAL